MGKPGKQKTSKPEVWTFENQLHHHQNAGVPLVGFAGVSVRTIIKLNLRHST